MRIALTGGTGFIGQCLLRDNCDEHEFVVFASRVNERALFEHPNVEYVETPYGGEAARDALDEVFARVAGCDGAVNLGFARPRAGRAESFDDYLPSVRSAESFFKACASAGVINVVHVSTRSVYGKSHPVPHVETEPPSPFSCYGAAKLAAEALADVHNERGDLHVKILRFAQVIGVNEYQGVVSAYLKAYKAGTQMQVWGSGEESAREYLYVRDAAAAVMAALCHAQVRGVFNIGTGKALTVKQILQALASCGDSQPQVVYLPDKPVEHVDFYMACDKAVRELGWRARWSFEDALAAMLADEAGLY